MEPVFKEARRIWTKPTAQPNQYGLFRQTFFLEKPLKKVRLRLRADNRYAAELNGRWIPAQQYADYPFYPVYDEIELPDDWLSEGENTLMVLGYCQNEDSSTYRKGEPSLIYELTGEGRVLAASGTATLCTEQTGFICGSVERFSGQLSYSFRYDAARAFNPLYRPAWLLPDEGAAYHPRPIPQLETGQPTRARIVAQGVFRQAEEPESGRRMQAAWLRHKPFAQIARGSAWLPSEEGTAFSCGEGDGIYVVLDLSEEQAGYLLLDLETPRPCRIDGGVGEHLEDLRVRTAVGGRNFAFTLRTAGGRCRFFWPIKRLGCRYLQLHVESTRVRLYYAGLRPVEYPVSAGRMPEGLDGLQRRIYTVSVETLRRCMHEHYEDCPWREQALYAMDSRNQMLFGYDAFGETVFPRENLRLLSLGLREDGLLELCAPAKVPTNIPAFSLIWITALAEYYEKTGDRAFIRDMLPVVRRVLDIFSGWEGEGLLRNRPEYWNFYEWNPGLDGVAPRIGQGEADAPLNAFYAMALRAASALFGAVGDGQATACARQRVRKLQRAYRQAFYSPERGAYRLSTAPERREVYAELTQVLTLCAGLCADPAEQEALTRRLPGGEFQPSVTLSHRIYYYQALLRYADLIPEAMRDVEVHWGPMAFAGATAFWETSAGASDFEDAGSLCHGWSAAPVYVYHRVFAGDGYPRHPELHVQGNGRLQA